MRTRVTSVEFAALNSFQKNERSSTRKVSEGQETEEGSINSRGSKRAALKGSSNP